MSEPDGLQPDNRAKKLGQQVRQQAEREAADNLRNSRLNTLRTLLTGRPDEAQIRAELGRDLADLSSEEQSALYLRLKNMQDAHDDPNVPDNQARQVMHAKDSPLQVLSGEAAEARRSSKITKLQVKYGIKEDLESKPIDELNQMLKDLGDL